MIVGPSLLLNNFKGKLTISKLNIKLKHAFEIRSSSKALLTSFASHEMVRKFNTKHRGSYYTLGVYVNVVISV